MKRFATLLLALCMLAGSVVPAAADVSTPSDLEPTPAPATQAPTTEVPTAEPTEVPVTEAPTEQPAEAPVTEAPVTEAPTEEPEVTVTPEVTEQPEETQAPTAEPSEAPSEQPSEAPTEAPAETPATEAPATEAPTAEPTAEPTPELPTADYGEGPLYVLDNGFKHYGTMEELMPLGEVLYLYHTDVVEIEDIDIEELSKLEYALDPEVFKKGEWTIFISVRDPNGVTKEDTVYLWAGEKQESTDNSDRLDDVIDAEDEDLLEWELQVIPADYVSGEPCRPTFTLMALPELTEGMRYAVILDGGEAEAISGSVYVPEKSGEYRFAVLDASGQVVGRSAKYKVTLAEITPAPTEEPTPEPTAEPTEEPTPEPTAEPTEEPTPEPTVEPTEEPTPEPTAEPTEEPTPEPSATPDPALGDLAGSMESFINGSIGMEEGGMIAWGVVNGQVVSGSLAEMLKADCTTVYISTRKTIILEGDVTALSGKTLLPDPEVFGDDYVVTIANNSSSIELDGALFVSVTPKNHTDDTDAVLNVTPKGFTNGRWQNEKPVFGLDSDPDLPGVEIGYSFAVSVDGSAPVRLAENSFTAEKEGEYTLSFSVVDADNQVLAQSESYKVKLDLTAPLLQVSPSRDGTMMVVAGDLGSGAASCSLDGGETWQMLQDQGEGVASYTVKLEETTEYAPGMIIVQDKAGNRKSNEETVTVTVQGAGGFGGFGGFGGSKRSTSHSASSEGSVVVYNGVELILDDGSMTQLIVGDEVLDLLLVRDDAAEDPLPAFTAAFTVYDGEESDEVDTLVLAACDVPAEETALYTWQFSGQLYKKLAASGIDYLVLRVADQVTVLSTAGFTAGIRYSMFRAEGLPSKDFIYTLRMGLEDNAIRLDVTVNGRTWQLTEDPTGEFYYYDVITGTVDQFDILKG